MEDGANSRGTEPPQEGNIPTEEIRAQVAKMLRSRSFRAAPRCGDFLSFVVDQKLKKRSFEICAESIRQRLYPKARGHDPEAGVRAAAGRLRSVLDRYYKAEGDADPIRISIPVNTYEPEFAYQQKPPLTLVVGARGGSATSGNAMPKSSQAFELLCEGRRLWSERRPDRVAQAIMCFDDAIREEAKTSDRPYAAAYSALAECYTFLYVTGARHADVYYKALGAAAAGVTYAQGSADAHAALGAVQAVFERNWAEAEVEFRKALELNPDCLSAHGWFSGHLSCLGREEDAIHHARRAMAVDPLSTFTSAHAAKVLYFCRRYPEAEQLLLSLVELAPEHFLVRDMLGMTYAAIGKFDLAVTEFQKASALSGGSPLATAPLGNVYGRMGKKKEAEAVIRNLEQAAAAAYVPQSQIAQIWIGLGQNDSAFGCLDLAFEHRDFFLTVLHGWEPFDAIRREPRFLELTRKLNIPGGEPMEAPGRHVTLR